MKKPVIQPPAVCSVSQMADFLGLSRERFYQLQKAGVFPPPVYGLDTKRPFYPLDLQQRCILIRGSGIGFNGQTVLFNKPRKSGKSRDQSSTKYGKYVQILERMGFKMKADEVKSAMDALSRAGLDRNTPDEIVIRNLIRQVTKGTDPDVQSQ
jgi:hypothetical protein